MILICVSNASLRKNLKKELTEAGVESKTVAFSDSQYLNKIYADATELEALVVDSVNPKLPIDPWLDILDSIGRRLPVIVLAKQATQMAMNPRVLGQYVACLDTDSASEVLSALEAAGVLSSSSRILQRDSIPLYNDILSLHMFKQNGALSMLSIHSPAFRKVAIEYGAEAYRSLQQCFQHLLIELWGSKGSFRRRDILCRASNNSNTYYILLERSRSELGIPPPGSLERMADRLVTRLQNLFWHELLKPAKEKMLPSYLHSVPDFSVGHATALYNPCVDATESVESLIDTSREIARVQDLRINDRRRELMQTLIKTDHLLVPFFQGVFTLSEIEDDDIVRATESESLKPLEKALYSFESLIRANSARVDEVLQNSGPIYLEARYLRPDVLFSMAAASNLALELDQACLRHAATQFGNLPGRLMVNILPRNFYHIDLLQDLVPEGLKVIFEVSESEAINNFGLLLQAKEKLSRKDFTIAIDDFGKGYAGLDRIIKIQPHMIKLDRSLVSEIDRDKPKSAFVAGLVSAARITQSIVLAEGIERIEELRVLRDLGVDLVQGFLLHRPQSRDLIQAQLDADSDVDTVA